MGGLGCTLAIMGGGGGGSVETSALASLNDGRRWSRSSTSLNKVSTYSAKGGSIVIYDYTLPRKVCAVVLTANVSEHFLKVHSCNYDNHAVNFTAFPKLTYGVISTRNAGEATPITTFI